MRHKALQHCRLIDQSDGLGALAMLHMLTAGLGQNLPSSDAQNRQQYPHKLPNAELPEGANAQNGPSTN